MPRNRREERPAAAAPTLSIAVSDEFIARVAACCIEARPAQRLLSVNDAATYLGRNPTAVREMERTGKLRAVRIDGRVMFDRNDLDDLIEASKS